MKKLIKRFLIFFLGEFRLQKYKKIALRIISLRRSIKSLHKYRRYSSKNADLFFGYYDINPFNHDNSKMLFIKVTGEEDAQIGYIRLNDNVPVILSRTSTWNWQQGCRLRWFPNDNKKITYNDFKDGRNCCIIYNIDDHSVEEIELPFYDISEDGKFGLSLDFIKLSDCRPGYGYRRMSDFLSEKTKDKIILYDFTKKSYSTIIDMGDLVDHDKEKHYFNHLKFSPNNDKFLFFLIDKSFSPHKASLYVYNIIEKKIIQIETHDIVSHYVWLNNDTIIATTYGDNKECNYVLYSITEQSVNKNLILNNINRDGHPSIYSSSFIITDEYPDKYGFQSIYKMGISDISLEKYFTSYSNHIAVGEKRCDLHPRLNNEKDLIQLDVNINGFREIVLIELRKRNDYKKKHNHYSI